MKSRNSFEQKNNLSSRDKNTNVRVSMHKHKFSRLITFRTQTFIPTLALVQKSRLLASRMIVIKLSNLLQSNRNAVPIGLNKDLHMVHASDRYPTHRCTPHRLSCCARS